MTGQFQHLRVGVFPADTPAMVCIFESLLGRKKARLQALIAVARKLLHAIFGMFRSGLKYEGTELFPQIVVPLIQLSSSSGAH